VTVALHPRARTTRLWAVGVLVLGTLALAAYLALVLMTVWFVGSAIDAVSTRDLGPLDVSGYLVRAVPGLIVGWCTGLATSWLLSRGEALSARAAGLAAGAAGLLVGAVILALTGVL
jgi:hypothetical protein